MVCFSPMGHGVFDLWFGTKHIEQYSEHMWTIYNILSIGEKIYPCTCLKRQSHKIINVDFV